MSERSKKPPGHNACAQMPSSGLEIGYDDFCGKQISARLERLGVRPTTQRIAVAAIMLQSPIHLTAERVHSKASDQGESVSRATIYNTLNLFVAHGLLRQVVVDAGKVFYDSNTCHHYHLYDMETGELTDLDPASIEITRVPDLPDGRELESVDVVIRCRKST